MATVQERNPDATVYVGDLDQRVTESMLWELFLQAGPVVNVYIPRDKVTTQHNNYGFVEFRSEEDAEYSIKIMNMIKLHGKGLRVNRAARDKKTLDVGANLFIGNLDPEVDEKLLYDTFSTFGVIVSTPKIMRDPDTGASKGFGFVSYDSFDSSDAAIQSMNNQYLCGRPISVTYAYKKDTKGERHGSAAERLLASSGVNGGQQKPNMMFATAPPGMQPPPFMGGMPGMPNMPPMGMPPMPGMPMMQPPPFMGGPPMPGMGMPGMPGMPMMGMMPPHMMMGMPPMPGMPMNMQYPPPPPPQ